MGVVAINTFFIVHMLFPNHWCGKAVGNVLSMCMDAGPENLNVA